MNIQENVNICDYCTLKVGGIFSYFASIDSIEDLEQALQYAKENSLKVFIIGGGSNMVFPDGTLNVLALKMNIQGFEITKDEDEYTEIKIGAGELWDSVVARTVALGLSGIEALSAIPGTAGATPVQNVGAYGQEIKNVLISVEVYDIENNKIKILSNTECVFTYRDSIFKNEAKGKYIITAITLKLLNTRSLQNKIQTEAYIPNYPGVKMYFNEKGITDPSLLQIREAIIHIRSTKLPDPKIIANVGSFFKNPIITKEEFENIESRIGQTYAEIPHFDAGYNISTRQDLVKIPAGWLIENAGLKGKSFGPISTYVHNAIVLVNDGSACFADVVHARDEIIITVHQKFGITLECEPEFVK